MNYNQNHKISQITSETLIVGVDIAKHNHVARAQDFRGLELGKTCFFENTKAGFHSFLDWINQLVKGRKLNEVCRHGANRSLLVKSSSSSKRE